MRSILSSSWKLLTSFGLSCVLLITLGVLTWLGTLEQQQSGLFEVQQRYFESWLVVSRYFGPPIPLPGATLVMVVLFANLVLGGIVRMRKGWATAGILVTHCGILFLLVAALVKFQFSHDGHTTLYEGEGSNTFDSYNHWELALLEKLPDGSIRESVAAQATFDDATPSAPARLKSDAFPFELEVTQFVPNGRVFPKGPMVKAELPVIDGYFIDRLALDPQNEANVAGAYVALVERENGARRPAILWGAASYRAPNDERERRLGAPWTVAVAGRTFGIVLRRERYSMPFTVALDDFKKEDHPRLDMAKAFSSDVTVIEGASTRAVKISMNEPLRAGGLVVYQAGWGPDGAPPGTPLFSTLAVVHNPADQYPLYACIVIAVGLSLHFARKLMRHIRSEAHAS